MAKDRYGRAYEIGDMVVGEAEGGMPVYGMVESIHGHYVVLGIMERAGTGRFEVVSMQSVVASGEFRGVPQELVQSAHVRVIAERFAAEHFPDLSSTSRDVVRRKNLVESFVSMYSTGFVDGVLFEGDTGAEFKFAAADQEVVGSMFRRWLVASSGKTGLGEEEVEDPEMVLYNLLLFVLASCARIATVELARIQLDLISKEAFSGRS